MKPSHLIAGLAGTAALAGLRFPELYRDPAIIRDGFLANDVVTLLLAIPILIVATLRPAPLLKLGALHYFFYNYCFYLFGAALNPLLPVYAAIVGMAGWSIALALRELDLGIVKTPRRGRRRAVAGWLAFVSAGLAVTWIAQWLVALFRTTEPARFDLTPEFVRVTAALDLTLMVGLMVPAAVLLWRNNVWGTVLGAMTSVSGAIYNVVLVAGTVAQIEAGLAGASFMVVLWMLLGLGCVVSAWVLSSGIECAPADELAEERGLGNVLGVDRYEAIDQEPKPVRR